VPFFGAGVGDDGLFLPFGGGADPRLVDAEIAEIALDALGPAAAQLDVVLRGAALVAVTFDQDLLILDLVGTLGVGLEDVARIGADRRPVEVKVDVGHGARGVFANIVAANPGRLALDGVAASFALGVAGPAAGAHQHARAVLGGLAGRLFGYTLVILTGLTSIAITRRITIIFTDVLTRESRGIATLATDANNIGTSLINTSVSFALLTT